MGKTIVFLAFGLGACWLVGNLLKVLHELVLFIYRYSGSFLIGFIIVFWSMSIYSSLEQDDIPLFLFAALPFWVMFMVKISRQDTQEKTGRKLK